MGTHVPVKLSKERRKIVDSALLELCVCMGDLEEKEGGFRLTKRGERSLKEELYGTNGRVRRQDETV